MNNTNQPVRFLKRILYIDHEFAHARIAEKMLRLMGYEVVIITNSLEAIDLFKSDPYDFILIIVDIVMPDMTGFELSQSLLEIRSDIPVIIRTYQGEMVIEKGKDGIGIKEFLNSPLLMGNLETAVNEVIKDNEKKRILSSMSPRITLKNMQI